MKEVVIDDLMREYGISRRQAEELLNVSLFYNYSINEVKEIVRKFYLNEA